MKLLTTILCGGMALAAEKAEVPATTPAPQTVKLEELEILRIKDLNRTILDMQFRLNALVTEACGKAKLKTDECQIDLEARTVSRKPPVVAAAKK